VYNAALFLHDTLDSVLKQSFQDFELICVDDGSTDGSLDILKKYASKDSRALG
jgi:glycosyltransferase involved in cell wall biosynthesis